ncbi:MAG: DUF5916 domain-containing protein [Gemmatimonadetes bacterium]|nr:DUF5916 domain-containing protein [Gemmatimonadota bacterium]
MLVSLFLSVQVAAAQGSPSVLPSSTISPTATTATVYHGRTGQSAARIPRSDATVLVDGKLDEPVWRTAAVLTGFSLYSPVDQRPAPDSTEVLVWYSTTAIHFGIRAFEPHGKVAATLADRDRISADDNIELHLDTFFERRRAFVFIVNPLGVQADGTKAEGGGFIPGANVAPGMNDLSADFVWDSKGEVTDFGYQVEVRIPFKSLRYPIGSDQTWGLQIDRKVQHNGYEETWTPALKAGASFIAQEGTITGLSGMLHGQTLAVNPELTNAVTGASDAATANWKYTASPQIGGNIRWGIGSNFVANGTIKPDFSQVESDAQQIATDARFALFYPERRPFFVEGSDQFNVPNTLVYTRRIAQPDAAAKFTGKVGRADIALLSAVDGQGTGTAHPMVNILRLQQAFNQQNTVGLLFSDRSGGGRTNRVIGADTKIVFKKLYFAQFQLVQSNTGTGNTSRSGPLWEAVVDGTGRAYGFHYSVLGIHPDFSADNGFVARTGIVQPTIANRISVYGAPGSVFERYTGFLRLIGTWKYDDFFAGQSVLERTASMNNSFTFRGGWTIGANPTFTRYAFDSAAYTGTRVPDAAGIARPYVPRDQLNGAIVSFSVTTPQFRRFTASLSTTLGQDVDFLEVTPVRRRDVSASLDLRPTEQVRITATWVSSNFTRVRDGVQTATTRIPRLKTEYQISRAVFVRVVSQYEASVREPLVDPGTGRTLLTGSGTTFTTSARRVTNNLRTDFLFSYRPSPGTVFFAGYGDTMIEPAPLAFNQLRRAADAFFLKASYVFQPLH